MWGAFAVVVALLAWRFPGGARTTLVFLLMLGILVFVHEWGHYQFARWAGMKVNRFGIGFPPWVYTFRRNNIEYSLGALPIGGMVDIAGLGSEEEMVATAKESTGAVTNSDDGSTSTPSRLDSYQHRNANAPHGEKQFQDASLGWRFMTLFAGPLMNFLFAIVIFVGVFSLIGLPKPVSLPRVQSVTEGKPAAAAGLQSGDVLVGVNDKRSRNTADIVTWIRASKAQPVTLWIERKGKTISKSITPIYDVIPGAGRVPSIGIAFDQNALSKLTYTRVDTVTAVKAGFAQAANVSLSILDMLQRAFTRNLSKEETEGVRGPVGIAQSVGESAQRSWLEVVLMAGLLSVNLGLLNLLPFPALDGGRILFLGYEFIARRPFDPRKEGLVHMVGMAMLLAFMLFITFRDVVIGLKG